MKALIIGASGTIGSAVVAELERDTEIVTANFSSGDFRIDLSDTGTISDLFKKTGKLDAVICAASRGVIFKSVQEMTVADYLASMQQKLFGQISVALEALPYLNDKGCITLTTGIMNRDLVKHGTAAALVNNAVEGFVRAAACDMPRGIRMNVVSPSLLQDSAETYADLCPGFEPVSSDKVARAYRRSMYGIQTGQVFLVK